MEKRKIVFHLNCLEHGGAERFGHLPIAGQFSTDGHGMVPPLHKFQSMIAQFVGFVKI